MNANREPYGNYSLCREMCRTPEIIDGFSKDSIMPLADRFKGRTRFFLTGEGSSRIFPAKRVIEEVRRRGGIEITTEGARQAAEYDLSSYCVLGSSNSGKTKELVELFRSLKASGHDAVAGITAHEGTPIIDLGDGYLLSCGEEKAVAATMSVVEQALVYQALFCALENRSFGNQKEAAKGFSRALEAEIDPEWIEWIKKADTIYFAGRNNGVAEELTLKTNEITRKRADYLEGTYCLHGIEEVMSLRDVIILIEPYRDEMDTYKKILAEGVGAKVIAISEKETPFPTLKIEKTTGFEAYIQLAAGWNLLVETGLALGVDLDRPLRARKIGNQDETP